MVESRREMLVVLDPAATAVTLTALRQIATVTGVLAPRLALVSVSGLEPCDPPDPESPPPVLDGRDPSDILEAVRDVAGVVAVCSDYVPLSLVADLSDRERLFVDAWETRREPAPHPDSGLPWDAPGHLPPDLPAAGLR